MASDLVYAACHNLHDGPCWCRVGRCTVIYSPVESEAKVAEWQEQRAIEQTAAEAKALEERKANGEQVEDTPCAPRSMSNSRRPGMLGSEFLP